MRKNLRKVGENNYRMQGLISQSDGERVESFMAENGVSKSELLRAAIALFLDTEAENVNRQLDR